MLRHLVHCESDRFGTGGLPNGESSTLMHREPASQVRQIKGALTISAVSGSNQGKQDLVLRDGNHRPIAKRPAYRRKIPAEHPNFTNKWL